MVYTLNLIIVYIVTSVFFILGIYLAVVTNNNYKNYHKRSLCTSALCLFYHESYVALACYSAWFSIWPIFNLSSNLNYHLAFYIIGFFPLFSGLTLYILYLKQMKSFPRAVGITPDELVTDGIYSITRNPQSLGRGIGLIGIAIIGRSYYTLLLAIFWILINHVYILIEEDFLESKFGESYLHYCSITPRYYKVIRNNGFSKSL